MTDLQLATAILEMWDLPAFQHMLERIAERTNDADHLWINCMSSDPYVMFGAQRTARATRLFEQMVLGERNWALDVIKVAGETPQGEFV